MTERNLSAFLKENGYKYDEPFAFGRYSSLRVGGDAAIAISPTAEQIPPLMRNLRKTGLSFFVVGGMTNLLMTDGGYDGALVRTDRLSTIRQNGMELTVGAGVRLPKLMQYAAENGLGGGEALAGIPGTVGGAVYQNAGAFGVSIADLFVGAKAYDPTADREIMLTKEDIAFSYRRSALKDAPLILIEAILRFVQDDIENIQRKQNDFRRRRAETQPLDKPSLGSFYLRVGDKSAGEYIDRAGLKGLRVGGAAVSEKHAGFLVNLGGATATDFLELSAIVQRKVKSKFGITLQREAQIIGILI